ncbi:retrovirus-related pol polyprotein from transposon TNT 1-94 [Tanacetum coccineum]
MIALRIRDVYVLDMTSSAQEPCFFAKAFDNLNWIWHKRLAHLNFKTINKLAKQNLVIGLPSLVYSKDKPCSSCEKGKHHRASFKTKHTFSIKKCLHLLHMDLFGPVTPRSINHEKYTLVIVDEYSRTDNGTEFKNSILVNFCDEKGISQNFSSPYTPKQNGVAKRKNRTLIEAARTMLSGSRIPNINLLHVFGCPVYIHNHKDHLGKFDEKADDSYLLGYSLVSKAFRVFNTRRQQTEETFHITFDEIPNAIKFLKPSVDNINIAKNERYPPDEYLHPYEPSQKVTSMRIRHTKAPNPSREDYDEELEMEPRPERTREVTPPLRTRSPRVRRQRERVVGFKEAPNREISRIGRNIKGNGPSKAKVEENGRSMFSNVFFIEGTSVMIMRELQSLRHTEDNKDKVYEEREESCWILHLRTGIFYPKSHEGVMNEVPDGAAIFASSYCLRNSDMYRV